MRVKQIETLIMIVFIALFSLCFFWLRDYRKSKGIKDENPNVRSRFDYPYLSQLVDVEEERIRAFHKRLRRMGIPDHIVLIGVTPYCEECFNLLKRDDGKWEVFYGERGQKTNPRVFDTFEEAGDDLISRL